MSGQQREQADAGVKLIELNERIGSFPVRKAKSLDRQPTGEEIEIDILDGDIAVGPRPDLADRHSSDHLWKRNEPDGDSHGHRRARVDPNSSTASHTRSVLGVTVTMAYPIISGLGGC